MSLVTLVAGEVTFQDKVGVFWLKSVMEFDDNVDMKLDRAEFCQLYTRQRAGRFHALSGSHPAWIVHSKPALMIFSDLVVLSYSYFSCIVYCMWIQTEEQLLLAIIVQMLTSVDDHRIDI